MDRSSGGSRVDGVGEEKAIKGPDPRGRLDMLAERLIVRAFEMEEKKRGLVGFAEWAAPLVKALVREVGIPKKRMF